MIDREDPRVVLELGTCYKVEIYSFPNGMTAVCELTSGFQVPELQGRTSEVSSKIRQAEKDGEIKILRWNR